VIPNPPDINDLGEFSVCTGKGLMPVPGGLPGFSCSRQDGNDRNSDKCLRGIFREHAALSLSMAEHSVPFWERLLRSPAFSRWDPPPLRPAAFLPFDYGACAPWRHRQASARMHVLPSWLRPASFPARALAGPQVRGPFRRYATLRVRLEACARREKPGIARRTDSGGPFRFGNGSSTGEAS